MSFLQTSRRIEQEQKFYNVFHSRNREYPPFQNLTIMIVGNKCDVGNRSVGQDEILNVCTQFNNAIYVETSAKEDIGINELFNTICFSILQKNGQWGGDPNAENCGPGPKCQIL